jgi:hypothetical protein
MSSIDVIDRLTRRLFGSPILRNSIRGEAVEEIVAMALEPGWELCSGDWGPCDLIRPANKLRIQVKQSAARQSWHKGECPPPKPRFSIAEKAGRWEEGDRWVEEASRNADIFIFAWHPITDATADHRDPDQWLFHLVLERDLPPQKSISLPAIHALAAAVPFAGLAAAVEAAAHRALPQQQQ